MTHRIQGNKEEIVNAIENAIVGRRSERNRRIMIDHYVDGMTFEEVAEKHDMSVRHVKKISYDNEPIVISYLMERKE